MNGLLGSLAPYRDIAVSITGYCGMSLAFGAAIALIAALAARWCRGLSAATRYALWYVALVTVVCGPLATAIVAQHLPPVSPADMAAVVAAADRSGGTLKLAVPASRPTLMIPASAAYGIAALWLVVVLAGAVRFGAGIVVLGRLKRDALPLRPDGRGSLPFWSAYADARNTRGARLCVSDCVAVPIAVGLFDAMVVLPPGLLEDFDASDVDRFVLHELAHLERYDDWTSAFQRVAQVLLFFNPFARFIAYHLDLSREIACDDRVVAATSDVRSYAAGLTRMAESATWPHGVVTAAPAIFATRRGLSVRVEQLLARRHIATQRSALLPVTAAFFASLVAVAGAAWHAPVVGATGSGLGSDYHAWGARNPRVIVIRRSRFHDLQRATQDALDDLRLLEHLIPADANEVRKQLRAIRDAGSTKTTFAYVLDSKLTR